MTRSGLLCLLMACATAKNSVPTQAAAPAPPTQAMALLSRTPPPAATTPAQWVEPAPRERTLRNGLRVMVVEHRGHPLVSLRLLLPQGHASERADRLGVTWMALSLLEDRLEARNPDGELLVSDEKSVRRKVAEAGGSLGFGVGADASWLGIDGYAVDTRRYLETLHATVKARRHGTDGFAGRRDALLDALEDQQLSDDATLAEEVGRLAFGAGHPYAQRQLGTVRSLSLLGMEDVVARQNELLRPMGATLLVVGDVDAEATLEQVAGVFHRWTGGAPQALKVPAVRVADRVAVQLIPRTPARTTAVCGARALTDVSASDAALEVFAEALELQLQEALRERGGFTYGVEVAVLHRRAARAFVFCTRLAAARTTEGVLALTQALNTARTTPPSAASIDRIKASLGTGYTSARGSLAGLVASYATAVERHQSPSLDPWLLALRSVSVEQVQGIAAKALALKELQLVFSGERATLNAAVEAGHLGKARTVAQPSDQGGPPPGE
jgi:zinc protease